MSEAIWTYKLLSVCHGGEESWDEFNCDDKAAATGVKALAEACENTPMLITLNEWTDEFESCASLKRKSGPDKGVCEIYLVPPFGANETHDSGRTWVRSASKAMGPPLAKAVTQFCENPAIGGICDGLLLLSKSANKVQVYDDDEYLIAEGMEAQVCATLKKYTGCSTLSIELCPSGAGFVCNGEIFFPRVIKTDFDEKLSREEEFYEKLCREDVVNFIVNRWPRLAAA